MTATGIAAPQPTLIQRGPLKVLTGGTHTVLALLLVQSVLAGQFVDRNNVEGWITAHGVVADAVWVVAALTAGHAVLRLRSSARSLVGWSVLLFAGTLAETGVGHLITDYHDDWAIGIHIPLALALFAVGGWVAVRASRLARA